MLSGCGEDFGVLNRDFLSVGAQRIAASFWKVDDMATTALLVEFATQQQNALSETTALREAMLATCAQYPDPYYWAGFVINGLP
jgi:CHAT domain-containing protein